MLGPVGGAALEYGAIGRLAQHRGPAAGGGRPGGVLAGPRTHRLAAVSFEWGGRGELELKGKSGAFRGVAGPVRARASRRRRGLAGVTAPLAGRDHELRVAETKRCRDCRRDRRRARCVTGEPGVGKTRLLAELRRRLPPAAPARAGSRGAASRTARRCPTGRFALCFASGSASLEAGTAISGAVLRAERERFAGDPRPSSPKRSTS